MKDFFLYIWQLPQNLLGLVLRVFYPAEKKLDYKGLVVRFNSRFPSGISLGKTILLRKYPTNQSLWNSVKHEYGHHIQSEKYGWLYLIIIGIPSITFNIWDRLFHDDDPKWYYWYYNLPWEKDADEKGGVVRNINL